MNLSLPFLAGLKEDDELGLPEERLEKCVPLVSSHLVPI
jgi:hypothetical protein